MAYKGKFSPKFPKKYKGDPTGIVYRSLWERDCMKKFDENPNVIEWSSEETIIPYRSPLDGRLHRYFPDFLIKTKQSDGSIKTQLIEVKPKKETCEPQKKKRITKKYITEVTTWAKNDAKWKAAREFCADRKWDFIILTEDQIYGKNRTK